MRHGPHLVERRLDRVVCNHVWINSWSSNICCTLTKTASNHFPILFDFHNHDPSFSSQFKFLKMWFLHPKYCKVIAQCWNIPIVGCPMVVLSKKLKLLKEMLKNWNKYTFGNITEQVQLAKSILDNIQSNIDTNGSSDFIRKQEKEPQVCLDRALQDEESYWHQKSIIKWHAEGDRNTSYFHQLEKIRSAPTRSIA